MAKLAIVGAAKLFTAVAAAVVRDRAADAERGADDQLGRPATDHAADAIIADAIADYG